MTIQPLISVIIPTFNRAALLMAALESLARQTLTIQGFEVLVVDDGSEDHTHTVCHMMSGRLTLSYQRIAHAGTCAAKNVGIYSARAPILFFFDDDDVAHPNLLAEHLAVHDRHRCETVAVLGHTSWRPGLPVSPLMHYLTDVGRLLFSYSDLHDGQQLGFTYFWAGRISCKRSLLQGHGIFRHEFRFGIEDIELGYRLSRAGLRVIHARMAVQYMNRGITREGFCRRCEGQGRSHYLFMLRHEEDSFARCYWSETSSGHQWEDVRDEFDIISGRIAGIESRISQRHDAAIDDLYDLYGWLFRASKLKGFFLAQSERVLAAGSDVPVPIGGPHRG